MDRSSRRPLGRTGLSIEPVGYGAFKLGRNVGIKYSAEYDLPSEEQAARILNDVLDLGIDLIDTAPAYGTSEEIIGRAIAHRRDEFTLATKVGESFTDGQSHYDFSAAAVDASLDRSLHRLATNHLDIVSVHSDGSDVEIIERGETLEALARRKTKGDVRFVCFSGKTVEGHLAAIETGLVDCLMVEYHVDDDSQRKVIDRAHAKGIGVLVKKGLASGRLPPEKAIPHCLALPGVTSVVVASLTPSHIAANLSTARRVFST